MWNFVSFINFLNFMNCKLDLNTFVLLQTFSKLFFRKISWFLIFLFFMLLCFHAFSIFNIYMFSVKTISHDWNCKEILHNTDHIVGYYIVKEEILTHNTCVTKILLLNGSLRLMRKFFVFVLQIFMSSFYMPRVFDQLINDKIFYFF